MRIIITGGTGLIGSRLAERLAQENHEVYVLSRSPQAASLAPGVRAVEWDARTAAGWGELADGADAIVNLAGESIAGKGLLPARWTPERKQRILQSRLDAGRAVMAAIEQATVKPRVLVQSSAVGYYGPQGDELLTPDSEPGDDFLATVCRQWEASTAAAPEMGVRRVVVRTGLAMTMDSGPLTYMVLPHRFFVGGPLGSGRQWVPWIHLADVISGLRFLLQAESAGGPFNLVAPHPLTNREFERTIGRVMGRPSLIPVPGFAMKLVLGEIAELVLAGQRAVPARLLELGYDFQYVDAEAALRDLLHH